MAPFSLAPFVRSTKTDSRLAVKPSEEYRCEEEHPTKKSVDHYIRFSAPSILGGARLGTRAILAMMLFSDSDSKQVAPLAPRQISIDTAAWTRSVGLISVSRCRVSARKTFATATQTADVTPETLCTFQRNGIRTARVRIRAVPFT